MAANDFQKSPTVFQVRNNTAEKQKANTQTNETKQNKKKTTWLFNFVHSAGLVQIKSPRH